MVVISKFGSLYTPAIKYPYLNRVDFVPLSVAKVESVIGFEYGSNWTSTVIYGKCHSSINHLKLVN